MPPSTPVPSIVTLEALATALQERGASVAIVPPVVSGIVHRPDHGLLPVWQVMIERLYRGRHQSANGCGPGLESAMRAALEAYDRIVQEEAPRSGGMYGSLADPEE